MSNMVFEEEGHSLSSLAWEIGMWSLSKNTTWGAEQCDSMNISPNARVIAFDC
jgi:hypothetical protein